MSDYYANRSFIPGLILIVLGVIFLFDNLHIYDFWDVIGEYWPLILIAIGINIIIKSNRSPQRSSTGYKEENMD